ncbi:MAG: hypothetical protein KAR08_08780, partial [Candidatus Heimdallarchaeota archaeon]|nr:hypothetical protein [Candidatus Heimdallarchaeota archaeon]
MQSNKRILVYFLLIAVAISTICSIRGEYSFDSCNNTYVPLSSLSQDLIFDYNSTYKEQSFQLSFSEIEFDYFNKITLYFSVLGDKSNNQGISVSLSLNTTEVSFFINTLYQDNLEHNLIQAFPFPEKFIGSLNATLTCDGQSNSNEKGSLVISNIVIESIEPPLVQDATTALPLYPNWLRFQGSFSSISEELLSSFYYYDETAFLNATLSFKTNVFLCAYSRVELILNNETVELKDFDIGENSISFTTRPKKGLNFLIVRFKIFSQPTDIIEINNICLSGNLFINQEDIVYSDVIWEGDGVDHIFNLSSLKPESDAQELILHISLDYRCLGTKIYPNIFYELHSGMEIITGGEIFYLEQKESTQTIYIETFTCSFQDQLRFRVFGSTEGQGQFMIMNTSKILVESIQEFNGSTLDKLLVLDDIVTGNSILITTHEYFDVVKFCQNSTVSFSISFDIESDSNDSFNLIYFYLKIDESIVLFESINEKGSISFNSENTLREGYHEIKLCLTIHGLTSPIHLKNVYYKIKTFDSNKQNNFTGNLFGVDWILGIYGLVVLALTRSVISRKRIKKDAKVIDDQEYSLENKEEKEKVWLQYIKQILVAFVTYVIFYLPPVLLGHYHWGFIILASVCSTYAGLAAEFLEFRKISFRAFKTNVKKFLSEIDSISAFGKKLSDIFFSKFIYRTIISALVLGCLFFNIFVLLFIAERIQLAPEGISYFSFVIQNPWQGYYLLYGSIIFSILACYYMLHLAWEATFFEDNLKRVRVLGRASAFLLWGSWLVLIISFFVTTLKISIFGTIILPLLFTANYLVCDKFGKYKADQLDKNFTRFVKTGELWGNKKELKQALGYDFTTRTEWNEKKKILQKQKLQSVIIYKIKPNIPVYIHRLAELMNLPVKLTENLLIEILNKVPSLGVYHKEEGMFIKSDVGENIGVNNATNEGTKVEMEQTPRNTHAVGIAEEEEDEHYSDLKLDRTAIERDSEVNWVGI